MSIISWTLCLVEAKTAAMPCLMDGVSWVSCLIGPVGAGETFSMAVCPPNLTTLSTMVTTMPSERPRTRQQPLTTAHGPRPQRRQLRCPRSLVGGGGLSPLSRGHLHSGKPPCPHHGLIHGSDPSLQPTANVQSGGKSAVPAALFKALASPPVPRLPPWQRPLSTVSHPSPQQRQLSRPRGLFDGSSLSPSSHDVNHDSAPPHASTRPRPWRWPLPIAHCLRPQRRQLRRPRRPHSLRRPLPCVTRSRPRR